MGGDREAREICFKRQQLKREEDFRRVSKRLTIKDIYDQIKSGEAKELNLIVKGDVDGSVEAMCDVLEKMEVEDVSIRVIHKGVGAVSASDILLASASKAIVIGFHIGSDLKAKELAAREQVDVRRYNVIYEAVSDMESALKGLLEPEYKEEILGSAEIREIFHVSKVGVIAGSIVKSGKIKRNAKVRVIRNGEPIHDGKISSLKRFKNDVSDVQSGFECGIGIEDFNELQMKDILEVYKLIEIER